MATRTAARTASATMRYHLVLAVAASVAAIDLLTKGIATVLARWMPFRLPGGWVLYVVHNNGVIGGLGAGTIAPDIFAAIAAVNVTVLAFQMRHKSGRAWAVALGLITGGYLGNIGESRLTGYAVDWIWPPWHDMAFDLADVAIVCGQLLGLALVACEGRFRTRAAVAQ